MARNRIVGSGHYDRLDMGRHGVGALLELGPEGGVGVGDADALCAGASDALFPQFSTATFLPYIYDSRLSLSADDLFWGEFLVGRSSRIRLSRCWVKK